MLDKILFGLTLLAALGCGLNGGVAFAFSSFLMKALSRLPAASGMAAMQSINVVAVTPIFMTAFLGAAAICAAAAALSLSMRHTPGTAYCVTGSLLYLSGTILVTILFNVPKNNELAAVDPASAGSASLWASYLISWTAWNHVRTITSLAAAILLIIALSKTNPVRPSEKPHPQSSIPGLERRRS